MYELTVLKERNFAFFMRWIWLVLMVLLAACATDKRQEEIDKVQVDVELTRFDRIFANATSESLPKIKAAYPQFFPEQYPDSVWLGRLSDTLQLALNRAVAEVFPPGDTMAEEVEDLYKHARYYFPTMPLPPVYTLISDVDYQNPIIYSEQGVVIGLDNYLGSEHELYLGIPRYVAANMRPSQLMPQLAEVLVKSKVPQPADRSFLAGMIYHGKRLYLEQLLVPEQPFHEILGYSTEQWQWAQENEAEIWRYFIENELLFSTDPKLYPRFLNKAPFSKFYLEIDNESPGEIGRYIGYRIVSAFMERSSNTTVDQLIGLSYEELYRSSAFKPLK
jgi:gliding motility-associated lipoprotein GldB